jgi:hypothetical protein
MPGGKLAGTKTIIFIRTFLQGIFYILAKYAQLFAGNIKMQVHIGWRISGEVITQLVTIMIKPIEPVAAKTVKIDQDFLHGSKIKALSAIAC